jgi:hypothetical protein
MHFQRMDGRYARTILHAFPHASADDLRVSWLMSRILRRGGASFVSGQRPHCTPPGYWRYLQDTIPWPRYDLRSAYSPR